MKNATQLSRLALAALACTAVTAACTNDRTDRAYSIEQGTTSSTTTSSETSTLNNVGPAVAPASNDTVGDSAMSDHAKTDTNAEVKARNAKVKVAPKAQVPKPSASYDADVDSEDDAGWTDRTDGDIAVTDDVEMDDSVSGASTDDDLSDDEITTAEEDTTISGTTSVTGEEIDRQMRHSALTPFFHEPASRTPIQVGSTTITGKDKNMALFEPMNRFIDPAARERNLATRQATRPVADLNFNEYDYNERNQFKADMKARLTLLDYRIDELKSSAKSENVSTYKDSFAKVEQDQWNLERQVDDVRGLESDRWDGFRSEFRDQLATLEQDVARLGVALR